MNQLSGGREVVRYPIPGAYPESVESMESKGSGSSFIGTATSESHGDPLSGSTSSSDVDKEGTENELFGQSSSHSPVPAVAASLSPEGREHSKVSPPFTDSPAPFTLDPTLFQSNRLLPYDIELAKKAKQTHRLGIGGFSAVYLVLSIIWHH